MAILAVDVGATNTRVGLAGDLSAPTSHRTASSGESIVEQLVGLVDDFMKSKPATKIEAISIGCPGIISQGVVVRALYLPLSGLPVSDLVARATGIPTVLSNDVDAQAIGDTGFLEGRRYFVVSIGTAVGGACVLNGVLARGREETGSEVGHLPCCESRDRCACGGIGCLDMALAGVRLTEKLGPSWWDASSSEVSDWLDGAGEALSRAVRAICILNDLDYVHLVGRVLARPELMDGFRRSHDRGIGTTTPLRMSLDSWPLASIGLGRIAAPISH